MSGTSMDAIDAVLTDDSATSVVDHLRHDIDPALRGRLRSAGEQQADPLGALGELDVTMARLFAGAVNTLLTNASIDPRQVTAIGSHGQTIHHRPHGEHPFTIQIGDPSVIAELTGIRTVADFRRRDIAAGGQGAPLVPAFHAALLRSSAQNRAVLNIGGMANLTILPAAMAAPIIGFDTGPGNVLLDAWAREHLNEPMDRDGTWAEGGKTDPALLDALLRDAYFQREPPKSTGFEYFNPGWCRRALQQVGANIAPQDVQSTLTALTATTAAQAAQTWAPLTERLLVCGGGVHNAALMAQLAGKLPGIPVESTAALQVDPDTLEACAFAWLAKQTLEGKPGNVPSVTGARHSVVLGGIYQA